MAYTQLTYENRVTLPAFELHGLLVRAIGALLACHPPIARRELEYDSCNVATGACGHSNAQVNLKQRQGPWAT